LSLFSLSLQVILSLFLRLSFFLSMKVQKFNYQWVQCCQVSFFSLTSFNLVSVILTC
jgi:hypothetical protein